MLCFTGGESDRKCTGGRADVKKESHREELDDNVYNNFAALDRYYYAGIGF